MPTKKELEKQNRSLRSHVMLYTIIIIACIIMITWLTFENMRMQPAKTDCPVKDPDKFVYAYGTPVDKFINVSGLDPSCIMDIRDYHNSGGSVWVDIYPECVPTSYFTFRKE